MDERPTLGEAVEELCRGLAESVGPARAFILRHYTALLVVALLGLVVLAVAAWFTDGETGALTVLGMGCAAWWLPRLWRRLS